MLHPKQISAPRWKALTAVAVFTLLPGCGMSGEQVLIGQPLFVAECGGELLTVAERVTLDWSGGQSPIFPDQIFDPIDLSAFELAEGGTLADAEDEFKEAVRSQVSSIYCDHPTLRIRVVTGVREPRADGTTIRFTQALSPAEGAKIGEGEYDPCNEEHDNEAVIFGEQIRRLAGVYSFDEWVMVFANVTAHEIGHTLGFGHISREAYREVQDAPYVELMLTSHTMTELRQQQRFVMDQTNCPGEPEVATLLTQRIAPATVTCNH